jgi:hypothetical protein
MFRLAIKIIAYELGVSESTVKVYVLNILRKIGATNRTQAVYNAKRLSNDFEGARVQRCTEHRRGAKAVTTHAHVRRDGKTAEIERVIDLSRIRLVKQGRRGTHRPGGGKCPSENFSSH